MENILAVRFHLALSILIWFLGGCRLTRGFLSLHRKMDYWLIIVTNSAAFFATFSTDSKLSSITLQAL